MDDYRKLKEHLYPEEAFDPKVMEGWAKEHKKGDLSIWFTFDGYFWWPRTLLGIENHLCAFYDNTEVMNEMNNDILAFQKKRRVFDHHCLDFFC